MVRQVRFMSVNSTDMNLSKLQETVKDRGAWCAADHGVAKSWTQQQLGNNNKDDHIEHCT